MSIERPDWGDGEHQSFVQPNGNGALVPTGGAPDAAADLIREIEREYPPLRSERRVEAGDFNPLEGMARHQIEAASSAAEMLLVDEPNSQAVMDAFDDLHPKVQAKVYRLLATTPHLRGEKFWKRLYGTLTLEETILADDWLADLSEDAP
jgi:hypothetical protein